MTEVAQTPTSNGSWQVFPNYTGTDAITVPLFLLPPSFTYGQEAKVQVNQLYLGGADKVGLNYSNADFSFSFTASNPNPPYQANVFAQITLMGNANIWKCAPAARAALAANFQALLSWVETTLELAGLVVPGATGRIARSVIDALPLYFDEVLAYRYSLSTGLTAGTNAYINLLPGMRLLLETSVSQFITPGSPQNGYVSTAAVPITISSVAAADGSRTLTCDPFLGSINAPVVSGSSGPVRVAGGVVDLQAPGLARARWRLFYPTTMAPANQPGSLTLAGNVGLVATDTLAQLAAATAQYPTPVTTSNPRTTLYYVFLGRALGVPQIPIWLTANGQTAVEYVPIGTTIANIVERYTDPPLGTPGNVVTVMRNVYGLSPASVRFIVAQLPAVPLGMYDLPLLAGDGLTLTV
jgi:hypothetical protein